MPSRVCAPLRKRISATVFSNAVTFTEHGGRLAIGSDSNVRIALAEELRLLEYSQRLHHRARVQLTDDDLSCGRFLYEQANRGGAQALARDAGRIEVGALADLVALDGEHTALRNRHGDELLDAWDFRRR
jgi:formimidoylglutamate deiminase